MSNSENLNDDIPVFRAERATSTVKHRKYRADKRNPKKLKITITEDLGKIEQTQQFFFKEDKQVRSHSKEKNPNLVYLLKSPIKIGYYRNSKKCFIWQTNGIFSGELEKHDLKKLFFEIGLVLRGKK